MGSTLFAASESSRVFSVYLRVLIGDRGERGSGYAPFYFLGGFHSTVQRPTYGVFRACMLWQRR